MIVIRPGQDQEQQLANVITRQIYKEISGRQDTTVNASLRLCGQDSVLFDS